MNLERTFTIRLESKDVERIESLARSKHLLPHSYARSVLLMAIDDEISRGKDG